MDQLKTNKNNRPKFTYRKYKTRYKNRIITIP